MVLLNNLLGVYWILVHLCSTCPSLPPSHCAIYTVALWPNDHWSWSRILWNYYVFIAVIICVWAWQMEHFYVFNLIMVTFSKPNDVALYGINDCKILSY